MRRCNLPCIALASSLAAACGPRPMPAGYAGNGARAFVRTHSAALEQEIATGSGRTLYDLSVLAGCQDVPELGRRLHAKYSEIFTSSGANAVDVGATRMNTYHPRAPALNTIEPSGTHASADEVADRIVRILSDRRELRCLELDLSRHSEWAAGRRHIGPRRSRLLGKAR